jgi:hypothetical protein
MSEVLFCGIMSLFLFLTLIFTCTLNLMIWRWNILLILTLLLPLISLGLQKLHIWNFNTMLMGFLLVTTLIKMHIATYCSVKWYRELGWKIQVHHCRKVLDKNESLPQSQNAALQQFVIKARLNAKLFLCKIDLQMCDGWWAFFHSWRHWV